LGPLLVALGMICLWIEIGRREKVIKVFLKPENSWSSRGAIISIIFIISAIIYAISFNRVFGYIGLIFSILVAYYHGLLLLSSKGIPFWNIGTLPILLFINSLTGGGVIALALSWIYSPNITEFLSKLIFIFVIANIVIIYTHLYIAFSYRRESKASVKLLMGNGLFIFGSLIIGLFLPLGLLFISIIKGGMSYIILIFTGISFLIGVFSLRYSILSSGVYPQSESILYEGIRE
jgi:formate-dependent nitrite reductase membrane component NrfD